MTKTEILTCEVCGNDWEWKRQKGRKPKSCPGECRKKYPSLYSKRYRERPGKRDEYLAYMKEYHKTYDKENAERLSTYKAEWYSENRERIRAEAKSRYAENREEIAARNRVWRQENREKIAARRAAQYVPIISSAECGVCGKDFTYHKKGSERLYCSESCVRTAKLDVRDRWAARNQEKVTAMRKRYRRDNREKVSAYNARHRENNRSLYTSYAASRRAKIKGRMVEFVDKEVLLERDGWTCHICKGEIPKGLDRYHPLFPHIDHIVPLSKGGEHSYENTAPAHASCNIQKKDKLDGWQGIKPYVPEEVNHERVCS